MEYGARAGAKVQGLRAEDEASASPIKFAAPAAGPMSAAPTAAPMSTYEAPRYSETEELAGAKREIHKDKLAAQMRPRGRGGRGGRDSGRGGRDNRGGNRGGRGAKINVEDTSAFPTLGGK